MSSKLTIVTPTYNQAAFIKDTFDSVLAQSLPKGTLEYIVLDSLSDDGTDKIIQSYSPKFRKAGIDFTYIYKKDKGQADAISKGWKRATGDIVGYINSDDYYEDGVLRNVLRYFDSHPEVQWAYGGWKLVNKVGDTYSVLKPKRFDKNKLLNYCNIGQPSCFFRKSLLKEFGYPDLGLHLAFDYDLWLRFATKYQAGIIPHILSSMRYYGETKSAMKTKEQLREILKLGIRYSNPISWRRICQYFYYARGYLITAAGLDVSRRIR